MKVERSKNISAPIRLWAATCLIVWLLGFSVAVIAQVCSCCGSVSKGCGSCGEQTTLCEASSHSGTSGCGSEGGNAGCCARTKSTHSCSSGSGCSMTAFEIKPALPFALCDGLFLSVPSTHPNNLVWTSIVPSRKPAAFVTTHHLDPVIPPELRLGCALWSHAPPPRHA